MIEQQNFNCYDLLRMPDASQREELLSQYALKPINHDDASCTVAAHRCQNPSNFLQSYLLMNDLAGFQRTRFAHRKHCPSLRSERTELRQVSAIPSASMET